MVTVLISLFFWRRVTLPRRLQSVAETMDVRAQRYHAHLRSQFAGGQLAGTTTEYLRSHEVDIHLADEYVIGLVPHGERNAGRLAIPYLTRAGVKAFKFRCLADHSCGEAECPKYILEGDVRIYNPIAFTTAGNIIGISEGEIDAAVATAHILPTVGFPGASMWAANKAVWRFALRDYDDIIVFADGDKPGVDYARSLVSDLGAKAYLVRCDPTMDVASMVAAGLADELRERAGL